MLASGEKDEREARDSPYVTQEARSGSLSFGTVDILAGSCFVMAGLWG